MGDTNVHFLRSTVQMGSFCLNLGPMERETANLMHPQGSLLMLTATSS